jgi:hypothetical protein
MDWIAAARVREQRARMMRHPAILHLVWGAVKVTVMPMLGLHHQLRIMDLGLAQVRIMNRDLGVEALIPATNELVVFGHFYWVIMKQEESVNQRKCYLLSFVIT